MYLGEIVEQADRISLFTLPLHPYTWALISAVPSARRRKGRTAARVHLEGDPPSPIDPPPGLPVRAALPLRGGSVPPRETGVARGQEGASRLLPSGRRGLRAAARGGLRRRRGLRRGIHDSTPLTAVPMFTIYPARKVITMNVRRPEASHVAVRDGWILGAGALEELAGWGPHEIDDRFADKVIMPGLVEGHCHSREGSGWDEAYVGFHDRTDPDRVVHPGLKSIDEVVGRLAGGGTGPPGRRRPVAGMGPRPPLLRGAPDGRRRSRPGVGDAPGPGSSPERPHRQHEPRGHAAGRNQPGHERDGGDEGCGRRADRRAAGPGAALDALPCGRTRTGSVLRRPAGPPALRPLGAARRGDDRHRPRERASRRDRGPVRSKSPPTTAIPFASCPHSSACRGPRRRASSGSSR